MNMVYFTGKQIINNEVLNPDVLESDVEEEDGDVTIELEAEDSDDATSVITTRSDVSSHLVSCQMPGKVIKQNKPSGAIRKNICFICVDMRRIL